MKTMKTLQKQLQMLSQFLVKLSKHVDALSQEIDKNQGTQKKVATKAVKKAAPKKAAAKKKAPKKKAPKKKKSGNKTTVHDEVLAVIKKSGDKGLAIKDIKEKTNLASRQISNALYKLTTKGTVVSVSRGVYRVK